MKGERRFLGLLMTCALAANAAEPWTLERALDYAFTHNPDARIAQQRIAAAQAGLEQANSAFWPRLQVQSSYTRTDNPMLVFGSILNQRSYSPSLDFNDVPDLDDFNARGIVTVPLYAGGRNVASRGAAKANSEAVKQDGAAVRNALGFEISRAFHTVLKTRQFIQAADAAVHSFETNLVVANKRLEGGTLLKSDVLDVEVRLSQSREDLIRARNANTLAERVLRNLFLEIEQARLNLKAADERLAVSGKAVEQAAESAKLTRDRFEQGLALSTQLIDSETALVAARVRRAEAEADQRIAIAALRKALALPQLDSRASAK